MKTSTYAFEMEIGPLKIVTFYARLAQILFGTENTVQAKWVIKPINSSKELFAGFSKALDGKNYVEKMETEGPYPYWEWHGPYNPAIEITETSIFGKGLGGPIKSPILESFWLKTAQSSEILNIYYNPVWSSNAGNNYLVITNLDGTKGLEANIYLGFKIPLFSWLPYLFIPVGILVCVAGVFLMRNR